MTQKDLDNMADDQRNAEPKDDNPPLDSELANIIEAALYAAKEPLGVKKITSLFPDDAQPTKVDIQNVILALEEQCEHRGVELRRIGAGWRYQTKEKYSPWLRKLGAQKAPRYSRALLETLSIIAYRQPVTRGDIEEIRGVGVSSDTIRTLEERGWIAQIGHRDVPGRPALFGTSQGFLEYFDMTGLNELPELMEKRDLQLIAKDMNLTLPMDGVQGEADIASAQNIAEKSKTNSDSTESDSDNMKSGGPETGFDKAEVIELHPNNLQLFDQSDIEDDTQENLSSSAEAELGQPNNDPEGQG